MFFRDIVGQEKAKSLLRKYVEKQQIPHALLFNGSDGSGALTLAVAFAQYVNCQSRTPEGESCGTCPSCVLFQQMKHPDFIPFYPSFTAESSKDLLKKELEETNLLCTLLNEKKYLTDQDWNASLVGKNSKQLIFQVDRINLLLEKLSYRPVGAGYRVVVFWRPELMRPDAANRMLVTIEEPPERTLFLFVTSHPEELLTTILSRLQQIYLPPISEDCLAEALAKESSKSPEEIKAIAHAAKGSVILARKFLYGEITSPYLPIMQRLYRSAYKRDYVDLMAWSEEMAKLTIEEQKTMILYFAMMLREMFILHLKCDELCFLMNEELDFASKVSPFIDGTNVARFLFEYSTIYYQLTRNVNMTIAYSDFSILHAKLIKPLKAK